KKFSIDWSLRFRALLRPPRRARSRANRHAACSARLKSGPDTRVLTPPKPCPCKKWVCRKFASLAADLACERVVGAKSLHVGLYGGIARTHKILRRADGHNLPRVHERHECSQKECFAQIVSHQHHCFLQTRLKLLKFLL